ncbi:MAG TPA: endolytic transglycosylase MltG [Bacteroidales bacterium]|nr:endolytic transglycosylase MltG [Bacteroidales bacterium]
MDRKLLRWIGAGIIITVAVLITLVWRSSLRPIRIEDAGKDIYIYREAEYEDVKDILREEGLLANEVVFDLLAKKKNYRSNIKPGHYYIPDRVSNNDIMNLLRAGNQTPVDISFNNIRTLDELAGRLGSQLEADSLELIEFLRDEDNYSRDGFIMETVMAVFIPDTYEVYWTFSPQELYDRMLKEFNRFWSGERIDRASAIGLNPVEVSILASIVDDEVMMEDEKPMIAGVYLNRLRRNMPMQACPTIKFALNDFTIRRVLIEHLTIDSPYNTYKYTGLPPGPVRCATISGIESVLGAVKHDYLYFVARYDFSGYHHFSTNLNEHLNYANKYWSELDKMKIYN